jgi:hypothetical protein
MNKTLVAALGGIAFGSILGGVAASNCGLTSPRQIQITVADCPVVAPVAAPVCPAVLPPAPPLAIRPPFAEHLADDVDSQLSHAQTEYVNGNFQSAIDIATPMVAKSPQRAYRIIGAAACNLHKAALVDDAFAHLQSASRQYLVYACHRQGMSYTGSHFKLDR